MPQRPDVPDDDKSVAPPNRAAALALEHAERLRAEAERLQNESRETAGVATRLERFAELAQSGDAAKLKSEMHKLRSTLAGAAEEKLGVSPALKALEEEAAKGPARLREALTRSLGEACEARKLPLRVVSREDPIELRIAPFSVVLELNQGTAAFRFGREPIGESAAQADAIVAAHERLRRELDAEFDAARFFDHCRRAYAAALAAEGRKDGERLELTAFLPYLALQRQPKAFGAAPTAKNYRPYSKAQLAYDTWKLGESAGYERNGLRLCFGVATGTSASDKSRVVYFEDGDGRGEYKLTIFFTGA